MSSVASSLTRTISMFANLSRKTSSGFKLASVGKIYARSRGNISNSHSFSQITIYSLRHLKNRTSLVITGKSLIGLVPWYSIQKQLQWICTFWNLHDHQTLRKAIFICGYHVVKLLEIFASYRMIIRHIHKERYSNLWYFSGAIRFLLLQV